MDPKTSYRLKKAIEKCMYYLNGVKRSNSLHTKWPPVRTMDMATRNWQRYSCLDRISWMFSCPSTLNPPSAIIKWTPRTNKKILSISKLNQISLSKKIHSDLMILQIPKNSNEYWYLKCTAISIWTLNVEKYWGSISIPLRYCNIFQYRYRYFSSKTHFIISFIKKEISI